MIFFALLTLTLTTLLVATVRALLRGLDGPLHPPSSHFRDPQLQPPGAR
jgi:hypothetical protein